MRFLITGGTGFIGSALVRQLIGRTAHEVLNLDKLAYPAARAGLVEAAGDARYSFVLGDVNDAGLVGRCLADFRPEAVVHLAAETHVDRSIREPRPFLESNVGGTFTLLEACRRHWSGLDRAGRLGFRFHQVSTDEVFGSLPAGGSFTADSPYRPRSPYAASKAAADHLASAWHHTYGLPVVISHATNNYGPWQYPEKLIPRTIVRALAGRPLPVYGSGEQVRDWLHVEDHARGLVLAATQGAAGQRFLFGGSAERRNIDVVHAICRLLDELAPSSPHAPHERLISHVADRPGHDFRYAVDSGSTRRELDWRPEVAFEDGLRRTVAWYVENRGWWQPILDGGDEAV